MRIVVDAMGGDHAPHQIVRGAVDAVRGMPEIDQICLVGDSAAIERELSACPSAPRDRLVVLHASEVIGMGEAPAGAVRRKRDSSINRGMDLVKNGEADAFVSAGNTGAVVASATLKLRMLNGVVRPAIAAVMPTRKHPMLLVDAGATTDCDAMLLTQFAVMGNVYAESILHRPNPVVGLLSIGGEESKGNDTTKKTFALLSAVKGLNFRGNVEGHDVFLGDTDVVVSDGFVGNVVLKTSESVAHAIGYWMKVEFKRNPLRLLGALCLRGALKSMKQRLDPELYGGAPLLGVRGVCIITHGSSSSLAIYHAIRVAAESVHHRLSGVIEERIAALS